MTTPALTGRQFTPETARQAARRSAELRRQNRADRLAYAEIIDELVETFGGRKQLGPVAFAAVAKLIVAAVEGEIPVAESPLDRLRLADTARILHGIARLEAGESTSNSAHLHGATITADAGELERWRQDLLARLGVPAPPLDV